MDEILGSGWESSCFKKKGKTPSKSHQDKARVVQQRMVDYCRIYLFDHVFRARHYANPEPHNMNAVIQLVYTTALLRDNWPLSSPVLERLQEEESDKYQVLAPEYGYTCAPTNSSRVSTVRIGRHTFLHICYICCLEILPTRSRHSLTRLVASRRAEAGQMKAHCLTLKSLLVICCRTW